MKLHILNSELIQYGFPEEIINNDETFHGHQQGVPICVLSKPKDNQDPHTYNIHENYLPGIADVKEKNKQLEDILNNEDIVKIYQPILMPGEEDALKSIVYIPYYNKESSIFWPTANFTDAPSSYIRPQLMEMELLFSKNQKNRYVVVRAIIDRMSPADTIKKVFIDKDLMESIGCIFGELNGFFLDFYDIIGEKEEMFFNDPLELRNALIGARVLSWRPYDEEKDNMTLLVETDEAKRDQY